jgi:hypothetical protein
MAQPMYKTTATERPNPINTPMKNSSSAFLKMSLSGGLFTNSSGHERQKRGANDTTTTYLRYSTQPPPANPVLSDARSGLLLRRIKGP